MGNGPKTQNHAGDRPELRIIFKGTTRGREGSSLGANEFPFKFLTVEDSNLSTPLEHLTFTPSTPENLNPLTKFLATPLVSGIVDWAEII